MDAFDIIFTIVPIVMIVIVFISIFVGAFSKRKNVNENKPKDERHLKNEEIKERLKNLFNEMQANQNSQTGENQTSQTFSEFSQNSNSVPSEKNVNKSEDSNRCKNCGAELELDKHGRKKCPYCQSKYF